MEPKILFENDDYVAVNKPVGVMTHPDGRNTNATMSEWFGKQYPDAMLVGEPHIHTDGTEIVRSGVVHRLDADTSGVLVFAKTQEAHEHLKEAFKAHEVQKTYVAFVYGVPKETKGTISFPIGRSRKDFRLRSAQPKAKGMLREAVTSYETISQDEHRQHAVLLVHPKTGRTHQIRVHCKAIHHPIVCDTLYAPNHPCDLPFNRLGLHAYQLEIPLLGGERVKITAPLPEDLREALPLFPGASERIATV